MWGVGCRALIVGCCLWGAGRCLQGAGYDLQDVGVNFRVRNRLRIKKTIPYNAIFTTIFYGLSII